MTAVKDTLMIRSRTFAVLGATLLIVAAPTARPQQPQVLEYAGPKAPVPFTTPVLQGTPLPINLPTALKLVNARSLDISMASQRIMAANAQLEFARAKWLPHVTIGADYYHHDGPLLDNAGTVLRSSRSALYVGGGVNAILGPTDAIFGPLAARQVVRARVADLDTAANNSVLVVTEAYFNVQQARGDLNGAEAAVKHAEELVRRTEKLALSLVPPVEAVRARAELARRKQSAYAALERWRFASAELIRVLRLDPTALIDPVEPPHLRVALISAEHAVDALIPVGLRNRPELASQQALIEATLTRLKQERIRPLVPSLVLRGPGTLLPGSFTAGVFGGGKDALSRYGGRSDVELQVLWEFSHLLFGNRAKIKEREAENRIALLEHFRLQDLVAAEIAQAYAQSRSAADRLVEAESGLKDAADSVDKNFQLLNQTRRAGELTILLVRPQEVIAAIQTLAQANGDYYGATADHNRAQFRLYRALGYPAHFVTGHQSACLLPPVTSEK